MVTGRTPLMPSLEPGHPVGVNSHGAERIQHQGPRTLLRRPLATARPGLDHLRDAFVLRWELDGTTGAADLADAYLQACAGTPDEGSDLAAIARWIVRLADRDLRGNPSSC